jgi:hypothetical protein
MTFKKNRNLLMTFKKNRNFFHSSWRIIVLSCKILKLAILSFNPVNKVFLQSYTMTLTFHQWPWIKVMIKVMALPWVLCNTSVKYYSNSWTRWKVMTLTMSKTTNVQWPWPLNSDLGSRSWHFLGSSITILWNIIPIHAISENLWFGQCLNHYEHSDI